MKWLLIILFLNIQPDNHWEVISIEFDSLVTCKNWAKELNDKQDAINAEANDLGKIQLEQIYIWCEKK